MATRPRQIRTVTSKPTLSTVKSRKTNKETPQSTAIIPPSELLQSLSNSAETTDAIVKGLDSLLQDTTARDVQKAAMKAVNATSSAIALVHKSGWCYTSPSENFTVKNVNCTASAANLALSALRRLSASSNTERAALGLIGRLMAIHAWSCAWDLLRATRSGILKLCSITSSSEPMERNLSDAIDTLRLPLAIKDAKIEPDILVLISTYLSYSFQTFVQISADKSSFLQDGPAHLARIINSNGDGLILSWVLSSTPMGSQKQLHPLCTSLLKTSELVLRELSPKVSLTIRIYAVRCVLSVSSEEEATWIWKQVRNIAASYVKATSHDIAQSFSNLHVGLVSCVELAKSRGDPCLFEDPSFNLMCEHWVKIASRANDRRAVDYASSLATGPSEQLTRSTQQAIQKLSGYYALLEQFISDKDVIQVEMHLRLICEEVDRANNEEYQDFPSNATRLFQITERLRRRTRIVVDEEALRTIIPRFQTLLRAVLKLYSGLLKNGTLQDTTRLDVVTASLESLISLAKGGFRVQNPDTYEEAYQYLESGSTLTEQLCVDQESTVSERILDLRRCLSGAFWNLGSSLYQAGRWDHSVPFVSQSIDIDKTLLNVAWGGFKDMSPSWTTHFEQMPKRAMLLASCYIKMGNRQHGYDTYRHALRCSLQMLAVDLEFHARTSPSSAILSDPKYLQIITNIEKITYIGTLELFLGREVSLVPMAASLRLSPEVCGAIGEQQVTSLQRSFWKPEARLVIQHLLQESADVYSSSNPLRLVRVLCTRLEYAYYDKCPWEEAQSLSGTAIKLMECPDLKSDIQLALYLPQYLTSTNLWMAFHAHSNQQYDMIWTYAQRARDVLAAAIAPELAAGPDSKIQEQQTQQNGSPKVKRTSNRPVKPMTRKTQVPRLRKGDIASVPARTKATKDQHRSLNTAPMRSQLMSKFDCPGAFWSQIEISLNLFGALGMVQLELSYLSICCVFLKTRKSNFEQDLYAKLLIEFANECVKLGKTRFANDIFQASLDVINENAASDRTRLLFLLRFASFMALSGNTGKALDLYAEANDLSKVFEWDQQNGTTLERTRAKIQHYTLTALACSTYSVIQTEANDPVAASRGYMQAMRIWRAAIEVTQRFHPKPLSQPVIDKNPFDMEELASALPASESPGGEDANTKTPSLQRPGPEGWHLVLARESLETQSRLAEHYLKMGNHRDAEHFIQQCLTLSETLGAPVQSVKSLYRHADLRLRLWHAEDGAKKLKEAQLLLSNNNISLVPELSYLEGGYHEFVGELSKAKTCFMEGRAQLRLYGENLDMSIFHSLHSSGSSDTNGKDVIFPPLMADLLKCQIWLARDEEYASLLDDMGSLPALGDIKMQEKVLMARLSNHIARRQMSQESAWGSLVDSVISVPLGLVDITGPDRLPSHDEMMTFLKSVEGYCRSILPDLRNRGFIAQYREIILILVQSIATMTSLESAQEGDVDSAVALLDFAAAETLRREMLDCIEQKLGDSHSDNEWPLNRTISSASSYLGKEVGQQRSLFDEPTISQQADKAARAFWIAARHRHRAISMEESLESPVLEQLPKNWTVINISTSVKEDSIFITRSRKGQQSLMFCVPLKRSNRSEAEEAANFSVQSAIEELQNIVESSRQNGKRAGKVAGKPKEVRAEWWSERIALDQRLSDLLGNVEFCWLGAFKSILSESKKIKEEDMALIHDRFHNFFAKVIHKNEKKGGLPARINKALVEIFASLSPRAPDEELEDFVYFFLDLYQSTGHRVFLADLDVDEAVLSLRAALKDVEAAWKRSEDIEDGHVFLVLDKRLQAIPWESIPVLRGRSVSRIPSVAFLLDRLHLAAMSDKSGGKEPSKDRISVDSTKVSYLLNPEGDLKRTEETFTPWLKSMNKVGWSGIIGRRPADLEIKEILSRRDLFIYFGHGGAEQYIRGGQIRSLLRCSSTMLWGCSSGAMDEAGDFDRTGTPYNYLLGGCPCLVVNLWDVTDKDIDKFAQSVFNRLKLEPETVKARKQGKNVGSGVSVVRAVAESRDVCKLKYLTGAAPIVYGIPFYL